MKMRNFIILSRIIHARKMNVKCEHQDALNTFYYKQATKQTWKACSSSSRVLLVSEIAFRGLHLAHH